MRRTIRVVICLFVVLFFSAIASFGQSSISMIDIKSDWRGLGTPSSSHLVIEQKNGRFYCGSRRIPEKEILSFVDAAENTPPQKWGLAALGVDKEWLKANAEQALKGYLLRWQYEKMSAKQKELFLSSFSNHDLMERILTNGVFNEAVDQEVDFDAENSYGIDDFPDINIQIKHSNGDRYLLKSSYDSNFISTWIIRRPARTYRIHSAAISLGLWRLTPSKFTNRERLSDNARRYELAERLMVELRAKWDMLGAEVELGSAIDPVKNRFTIARSAVGNLASIDLNGGAAWNAIVRNPSLPSNVEISLSLPLRRRQLVGVAAFLERIDDVVQLSLSPSWFRQFAANHPEAQIEIRFVEDRSLSSTALQNISRDLAKLGKPDLLKRIVDSKDQVIFLELNDRKRLPNSMEYAISAWSRWIVMPNREMVLWQFKSDKVGNWSEKDFKTMDCYGWNCVGAVISDGGEILSQ